jgi:hypothetical protein
MCMPTNFGGKKDKSYKIRDKKKKKSDFEDDFFNDDFLKDKKQNETSNIKS